MLALVWPLRAKWWPLRVVVDLLAGESWLFAMDFGKNGDDPTIRRRRAPDQVLLHAQDIIRRHGAGEKERSIARGLGLARTSVHRVIEQYQAAQELVDSGEDLNSEYAALVSKYEGGLACEDARTPEDIFKLNDLELFRLGHLPADHPGPAARRELYAAGWRVVPSAERVDEWTVEWRRIHQSDRGVMAARPPTRRDAP